MSFRQGTHLSAHKKLHQKGEWSINFSVLIKLLVSHRQGLEGQTSSEPVVLPELKASDFATILPSLF
jgi:hypothetical protein